VDQADLDLVDAALGARPGWPHWNPNADLDRDGRVTVLDRILVHRALGNEIVPPATGDLAGLAAAAEADEEEPPLVHASLYAPEGGAAAGEVGAAETGGEGDGQDETITALDGLFSRPEQWGTLLDQPLSADFAQPWAMPA
jgi:hypothetical protein